MKTPLASTDIGLGLLERQQASRLTADQAAILSDLRKDHQRLVRIVSELLDMAQVETGRVRVEVGEHPLEAIVQEAVEAMRATAAAKRIRMDVRLERPKMSVKADADKAIWSLINLLSNALRHSPDRSTVTISSTVEGTGALLAVADQGPGLTDEQRAHLFEPFEPHAVGGTGLGLSISRDFMRAMGGDIALSSTSPQGSMFTIRFAGPSKS